MKVGDLCICVGCHRKTQKPRAVAKITEQESPTDLEDDPSFSPMDAEAPPPPPLAKIEPRDETEMLAERLQKGTHIGPQSSTVVVPDPVPETPLPPSPQRPDCPADLFTMAEQLKREETKEGEADSTVWEPTGDSSLVGDPNMQSLTGDSSLVDASARQQPESAKWELKDILPLIVGGDKVQRCNKSTWGKKSQKNTNKVKQKQKKSKKYE